MVGAALLLYHAGFDLSVMASGSMSPTLQAERMEDGDWVLTEKFTYRLRNPRRWEVVAFRKDDGMQVMKRVVALPGERVALREGEVVVDGAPAERPEDLDEIEYYAYGLLHGGKTAECGDGYFVLGDDSRDSQDSRFEGPLERKQIRGRSWLIVWPPSRMGFVCP